MRCQDLRTQKLLVALLVISMGAFLYPSGAMAAWSDWWKTPDQRALKLYEAGKHEELIEKSPSENWTGLGQFQKKDYSQASSSFENTRKALQADGLAESATTALYNQGVSNVLSGEYEAAIENFEQVLGENPAHKDAEHNRDIAKKLLELQQNSDESENQEGEQGQEGDENSESSDSEQSSENSESEQSEGSDGESQDRENGSDSEAEQENSSSAENSEQDDEEESQNSASEQQQQEEEQQARDALAAEAEQQEQQEQQSQSDVDEQMMEQLVESEEPLTESEQATEQILRRIPDDPRGLLRRKLEQSHRNEYPEVRDALETW